jgi:hypothetical protein
MVNDSNDNYSRLALSPRKCNVREVRRKNLADRQTKTEDLLDNYQGELILESLEILCLMKDGKCQ